MWTFSNHFFNTYNFNFDLTIWPLRWITWDRDVGINFPLGKTEQRWINWQNRFAATEEVLRAILESLKNE